MAGRVLEVQDAGVMRLETALNQTRRLADPTSEAPSLREPQTPKVALAPGLETRTKKCPKPTRTRTALVNILGQHSDSFPLSL